MDFLNNPYSSRRSVTVARRGMVATSQPLAVQAGISMLQQGGNAVDAALATAIALTVVEPTSNGIGADAFALVWDGTRLHGLNGSGRAAGALNLDLVSGKGHTTMPMRGWLPVTVPGAPAAWRDLHARFGKLPFAALFEPAIRYAEEGYPLSPILAYYWGRAAAVYASDTGPEFQGWMSTFAPGGRAPMPGEIWASPGHAATLRLIAESNAEEFYHGSIAHKIAQFAEQTGGYLVEQDLGAHTCTWVDPISTTYRGYEAWEIPPNGQGIAALIGLNILEGFDLGSIERDSVESFHLQIESTKLAFADALRYVADPDFNDVPTARLLDKGYAATRRAMIGERALEPEPGDPNAGGTVYLCAVDGDGMMVSFIQSNYAGFGSGVVVPGTGIALQNRGANFSLDPSHPNHIEPGKRPYHTIIPGFLTRDGEAVGPYGVMGGFMQPQGHLQMVVNTVDYAMNPQASLDSPRWQWTSGKNIDIEADAAPAVIEGLRARGHQLTVMPPGGSFGRGQIIWRLPSGAYVAGSDKRADGYAAGI
ncbi:MAG: gamma-glutamyltransferase family protein [Chloroflexota bacterium]